jgi:hypothetical protein
MNGHVQAPGPHVVTARHRGHGAIDDDGPLGGWTAAMGWSRDTRPIRPARKGRVAEGFSTDSPVPKTGWFTGSSCVNDRCSTQSRSRSTVRHTGRSEGHDGCRRSRHRWFAAQHSGQGDRMTHSGRRRVGSRGIGKPSTTPRAGNTSSERRRKTMLRLVDARPQMRPQVRRDPGQPHNPEMVLS